MMILKMLQNTCWVDSDGELVPVDLRRNETDLARSKFVANLWRDLNRTEELTAFMQTIQGLMSRAMNETSQRIIPHRYVDPKEYIDPEILPIILSEVRALSDQMGAIRYEVDLMAKRQEKIRKLISEMSLKTNQGETNE